MELLPVELIEMIFEPFSSLKEIQKCLNTNTKWRKILQKMFADKSSK